AEHGTAGDLRIVPLVEVSMAVEDDVHPIGREHPFEVFRSVEETIGALRAAVCVKGVVPKRKLMGSWVTGEVVGEPGQLGSANRAARHRAVEVRLPIAQVSTGGVAPRTVENVEAGATPIEGVPAARVWLDRRTQRPGAAVGIA